MQFTLAVHGYFGKYERKLATYLSYSLFLSYGHGHYIQHSF